MEFISNSRSNFWNFVPVDSDFISLGEIKSESGRLSLIWAISKIIDSET